MVFEYQLQSPVAQPPLAGTPSRRFARSRPQAPYVPWVFGCRASTGAIPFGGRGPALPFRFGPLRWLLAWASRSYLRAVCGGWRCRRAFAWRMLVVFAPDRWAHTFAWWVQQVTDPVVV